MFTTYLHITNELQPITQNAVVANKQKLHKNEVYYIKEPKNKLKFFALRQ